jgi:integrase
MASIRWKSGGFYARIYAFGKEFERALHTKNRTEAIRRAEALEKRIKSNSQININTPFDIVFDQYFANIEIQYHYKPSVIDERAKRAKVILENLYEMPIGNIDYNTILEFQGKLQKQYAPETIRKIFLVLKRFFTWAADNEIIFNNPTKNIKVIKGKPKPIRILSFDEIHMFLDTANNLYPNMQKFYTFLFLSMARMSEIRNLKWSDYLENYEPPTIRISDSKTIKGRRILKLSPIQLSIISQLEKKNKYLFPYLDGGYSRDQINKRARRCFDYCNIPDATTHTLRHTAATYWLQIHGDIYRLSRLLGHSTVSTTEIYLHIADADAEHEMNIKSLDEIIK